MNNSKMNRRVAVLWDENYLQTVDEDKTIEKPFTDKERIKKALEFFSEEARKQELEIYVANYKSCKGDVLENAFCFVDGEWKLIDEVSIDVVYNKIGKDVDIEDYVSEEVEIVVPLELRDICSDKYRLYEIFSEYIPKTYLLNNLLELDNIEEYFSTDKVVVKPRWGHGGEDVHVLEIGEDLDERISDVVGASDDFVIQEFRDSSNGIPDLSIDGVHDLRVIVIDSDVSYTFVRQPDSGYVSNVGQGGKISSVDIEEVPSQIKSIVSDIDRKLDEIDNRIYSVDLLFDKNGEPWVIELNSKPGIGFTNSEVIEQKKEFIKDIIALLKP